MQHRQRPIDSSWFLDCTYDVDSGGMHFVNFGEARKH
jgi:hypothetical protein